MYHQDQIIFERFRIMLLIVFCCIIIPNLFTDYWILMIHIMMDIYEHQDQRYTRGDNNGRDLYLLGVNVLV